MRLIHSRSISIAFLSTIDVACGGIWPASRWVIRCSSFERSDSYRHDVRIITWRRERSEPSGQGIAATRCSPDSSNRGYANEPENPLHQDVGMPTSFRRLALLIRFNQRVMVAGF